MDYNATTPVDPRVFEAMAPYFTKAFGNPASRGHVFGWEAEAAVDAARDAGGAGDERRRRRRSSSRAARPSPTTSRSSAWPGSTARRAATSITAPTEHSAVLDPCRQLEREGFAVTYLAPEKGTGRDPPRARARGAHGRHGPGLAHAREQRDRHVQPIAAIGAICREKNVLFHTDAVQGFGKIPFDVQAMHVDLASISRAQDLRPEGRRRAVRAARNPHVRLEPIVFGGGHERGMRSGTLNVPGIVGLGQAAELAVAEMAEEGKRLRLLRQRLWDGLAREDRGRDAERRAAAGDRRGRRARAGRRGAPAARATSTSPLPASTARPSSSA